MAFSNNRYGYQFLDALDIIQNQFPKLQDKHKYLLAKGFIDEKTRVEISVVVKYTKEFAATLGVYPEYGMYLLVARIIDVNTK